MWLKIHEGLLYTEDGKCIGAVTEARIDFNTIDCSSFTDLRYSVPYQQRMHVQLEIFTGGIDFYSSHNEQDRPSLIGTPALTHDDTVDGEFTEVPQEQIGHEES